MLRFFNTLSRRKEAFVPLQPGRVGVYTCGPTVYNFAHVGNFRAYVFQDVLHRHLQAKGLAVTRVMNLTDVDDKTIKASRDENVSLRTVTDRYTQAFFEDADALNLVRADAYPRATEHVPQMVALVKKLLKKGLAYAGDDKSIYYRISAFPGYGKLSHLDLAGLKTGARVSHQEYAKDNASDFVLWKAWDENDGDVFWDSELGRGRPGWHLECSTMSEAYLGVPFDIHSGGVDLVFPHHENEIAQTEGATGTEMAKFWLHNEHLLVNGQKMSKRLKNFYTVRDVLKKGVKPYAIRYFLLSAHYRQPLNLTFEALEGADKAARKFMDAASALKEYTGGKENQDVAARAEKARRDFTAALDDDLNTPEALAAAFDFIHDANRWMEQGAFGPKNAKAALAALEEMDRVLGLFRYAQEQKLPLPKSEIEALLNHRAAARARGDFKESDRIRNELKNKGIHVEDSKDGQKWRVA